MPKFQAKIRLFYKNPFDLLLSWAAHSSTGSSHFFHATSIIISRANFLEEETSLFSAHHHSTKSDFSLGKTGCCKRKLCTILDCYIYVLTSQTFFPDLVFLRKWPHGKIESLTSTYVFPFSFLCYYCSKWNDVEENGWKITF